MNDRDTNILQECIALDNAVSEFQTKKEQAIQRLFEFHTTIVKKSYEDIRYFHRLEATGKLYEILFRSIDDSRFKQRIQNIRWTPPENEDAALKNIKRLYQEISSYKDSCNEEIQTIKNYAQKAKDAIYGEQRNRSQSIILTKRAVDAHHLGPVQECIDPQSIQTAEKTAFILQKRLVQTRKELLKLKGIKYKTSLTTTYKNKALETFWNTYNQVS